MRGFWKDLCWMSKRQSKDEEVSVAQNIVSQISAPVEIFDNFLKTFKYDVLSVVNSTHANFQYLVHANNVNLTHKMIPYIQNVNLQDEDGNTLLHVAVKNKNELICTTLICTGKLNMNIVNNEGKNVLHVASEVGCTKAAIMCLLQKQMDVDAPDFLKFTPLHYALLNGHDDLAIWLLRYGADMNSETYRKESGYHIAFAKNCKEVINIIAKDKILRKIPVENFITIYGNTILHYINSLVLLDESWNFEIEKLRDRTNHRMESPVYYACAKSNFPLVRFFIEQKACQVIEKVGESLFHKAIRKNSSEIVAILKKFYNGDEVNKFHINCLESAAIYGCYDIAMMLKNYSRNYKNNFHQNTFQHYAAIGIKSISQMEKIGLTPENANFFEPNEYGMSPYLYLILYGKFDIVKYLYDVQEKQTTDYENLYRVNQLTGNTAIHYAMKSESFKLFSVIANNLKTHVNMPNNNCKTPLNLAAILNDPDRVKLLLQKFRQLNFVVSSCDTSLVDCIKNNAEPNIILLAMLIDAGCNVNYIVDKRTPLLLAIEGQKETVVKFLLSRNANIKFAVPFKERHRYELFMRNPKTPHFNTMLHVAVEKENTGITQALLIYGATSMINVYNSDGVTPLHWAIIKKHYKQVSILLAHGANINALVKGSQDTPLHLAARSGSPDLVFLLLKYRPKFLMNSMHCTPAVVAASKGDKTISYMLLQYAAANRYNVR